MACFLVPAAEAIVSTIATQVIKSKEKAETVKLTNSEGIVEETTKISFSKKLGWLNKMLWGGSALLAFEHVWHGEVTPFFPFLTAVKDGEALEMLKEMGTAGVGMALIVTAVWAGMVVISDVKAKQVIKENIK